MSALELRGLRHRYPSADVPTLDDVALEVASGSMLSVVGPSGSGKTTLLRVTAGLTTPDAGEVLLDGRPVAALPPEDRGLTVMFQQPHLFQHLSVLDNVAFGPRAGGRSRRAARDAARRYLELVHLTDLAARRPARLSGGQQQRVALARALATERSLLLLDEPFSSLDRELRHSMHDLLREVREALRPTVVMVTHDLDEASLADRVAVLVEGRVEQTGPVDDLYARPATLVVARLVGGFNEVAGTVEDGRHRSAWGALPLSAACAVAGPATLLLRREQLRITGCGSGPGPDVSASPTPGPVVTSGRVVAASRLGARQVVHVQPDGDAGAATPVEVELPVGQQAQPGLRVLVSLVPGSEVWAVPEGPASPGPQRGTPGPP